MNSIAKSLVSVAVAGVLVLGSSLPAFATWANPDQGDVNAAVGNIAAEVLDIAALTSLSAKNTKVVYLEDILNGDQVTVIKNSLNNVLAQVNILSLQNVLNLKNVLNGLSILSFGQFLSNNNASLKDVIAIEHFNDGGIIVFCCH
jgi:PPE-repeat protein